MTEIKAILFDLDGTLLDSDMQVFLPQYLQQIAARVAHLIPPKEFIAHLLAATQAMVDNDGRATNAQAFAEAFYPAVGHSQAELEPIFMDFYARDYPALQYLTATKPDARPTVQLAFDLGYDVVIATNPLFPEIATRQRMAWAGVDGFPYRLVTTYENSRFAKPNPRYFAEILDEIGCASDAALVVGDEAMDMVAATIGCTTFLVPSAATKLNGSVPEPAYRGTLADVASLLRASAYVTTTTAVALPTAPAEITEAERFHTSKVTLVSFGHFVHDTYTAFLAPLLPAFIAKFSLSATEAGLLSVFYQWPSLIQPYLGYLADRKSLRLLFITSPAITATMMCLLGIAPSYAVMAMLLIIAGFSSAGLHAVGPVIAGMQSGRRLGRGMSFWMVGGEAGRTVGPIVVVSVVAIWGLQGVPWLMLGGWLASIVLFIWLRNVPDRPDATTGPRPWRPALVAMRPVLLPVAGIMAARTLLIASLTVYLPTFLNSEGLSLWLSGAALSIMQLAAMGGALAGGPSSDRWGRRSILAASLALSSLFMFLFLGAQGWIAVPLLLLLGFSAVAVMPVSMALVQESFPQDRALANGIYMAINFLVQALGVLLLGALADRLGLRTAFTISAAVILLGLPVILLLPKRGASGPITG